jgi:hypothetical protein
MDTINTVITNWTTLSNTPIDWSLNGGVVWFLMMVAGMAVIIGLAIVTEARTERRRRRQALYRRAEQSLQVRRRILEQDGFYESF